MWRITTAIAAALVLAGVAALAVAAYDAPARHGKREPTATRPALAARPELTLAGAYAPTDPAQRNRLLHEQVSLGNLINALWLEKDQLREIIAVLERRLPEAEELAARAGTLLNDPAFGEAMAELRDTLMRGEEAGAQLRQRVSGFSGPGHQLKLDYEALRREIAAEIMPILTENQLHVLGEYKPCLFNANDPLHPERVGQASAAGRGVEMLTRLRRAPPEARARHLEQGLRKLAELAYKDTPFAVDVEAEIERLRGIVNQALSLSDGEFAVRAGEIAGELMLYPEAKDRLIADHYNVSGGMRDRRLDKLARQMVVPGAVAIFEAELAGRGTS